MPRRSSWAGSEVTSRSSMVMVPAVGSTMRFTIRKLVVLPQPDEPTSTVISPVGMSIDSPSTALVPSANRFVTLSKRITGRWHPSRSSRSRYPYAGALSLERTPPLATAGTDLAEDLGLGGEMPPPVAPGDAHDRFPGETGEHSQ